MIVLFAKKIRFLFKTMFITLHAYLKTLISRILNDFFFLGGGVITQFYSLIRVKVKCHFWGQFLVLKGRLTHGKIRYFFLFCCPFCSE